MWLDEWIKKWSIPRECVVDLCTQIGIIPEHTHDVKPGHAEDTVQSLIRLEATQKGVTLWRNNVGALRNEWGHYVRYGLANESKKMNQKVKSSDLIGIRPIEIKPVHVGSIIGQFVAREVKKSDWKYTGTDREKAQLKYIEFVLKNGGDASFASTNTTL